MAKDIVLWTPLALVRREIDRRMALVAKRPKPRRMKLRPDPATEHRFRTYQLSYWTEVGLVPARLRSVKVSERTGETVAEYDVVYRQPATGRLLRRRYLYGWRNAAAREPTKLREYPSEFIGG